MNNRQPWVIVTLWVLATVVGVVLGMLGVLTLVSRLALSQTSGLLTNLLGGAGRGAGCPSVRTQPSLRGRAAGEWGRRPLMRAASMPEWCREAKAARGRTQS